MMLLMLRQTVNYCLITDLKHTAGLIKNSIGLLYYDRRATVK